MTQLTQHPQLYTPSETVRQLLQQHSTAVAPAGHDAALARRLATLDRQAPELEQTAKRYGVEIAHLGTAPLPPGPCTTTAPTVRVG